MSIISPSAFKVRPWLAPGWAGLGLTAGIGLPGQDGLRKNTLHHFGYGPESVLQQDQPFIHRGLGKKAIRCESSGELFPEGRIKRQWDGKLVGDIYYKSRPKILDGRGGN